MNTKTNIKSLLILALVVLLGSNRNIAQNVGIGSESFTPDESAVLELKSTQQGFLPPRMTTEQRDEIVNPSKGLIIYNLDFDCIQFNKGSITEPHWICSDGTNSSLTCGMSSVTFMYNNVEVTYGIVYNSITERCWLDRNLGASQVAINSTDYLAYGDLFQWGRRIDGHQPRSSGVTSGYCDAVNTDTPPHSLFIKCMGSNWDWRDPQNPNLWQGVNGINNPCPNGWRIPTSVEWQAEIDSWDLSQKNSTGAYNSPLKLTMAGNRVGAWGSLENEDTQGRYWSSTVQSTASRHLEFDSSSAGIPDRDRGRGMSVRCIRN